MRATAPALLLCAFAALGCSDDDVSEGTGASSSHESGASASSAGGGGVGAGGSGGADDGGAGAGGISVAATDGALQLPFSLDATGAGTSAIGAIEIAGAVGTVVVGRETLAAVAYERQPFDPYVLYQLLAVDDDRLLVIWLYCQDAELVHVYWEGTDGTVLDQETATGSCAGLETGSTVEVAFPAVAMPYPTLVQGYTIDGPEVHIDGSAPGTLDLGAGPMVVLPFDQVDCTACGSGGWHEVHTLLWDPAGARVCFAIFYLLSPGEPVLLTYSLTLPDLSDPAGQTQLEATFTTPP